MDDKYFEALKNSIPDSGKSTNKDVNVPSQAFLTVKVDIDCKLYCDGDFLDLFEANKVKKISIETGQHLMTVESEHCDGVSEDHIIDAAEAGKNYLLLINGMTQKEQDAIQVQKEMKRSHEEEIKKKEKEEKAKEIDWLVCKGKECYSNCDYESAITMFKQAAELGNAEGQYELGKCYFEGKGVPCDENQAFSWWKLSAEQGHMFAQYRLGTEIPEDLEDNEKVIEGVKWLEMAAKQGYAEAQWQLGCFYATEWLSVYDPLMAVEWMKAAAAQGHAEAIAALEYRGVL